MKKTITLLLVCLFLILINNTQVQAGQGVFEVKINEKPVKVYEANISVNSKPIGTDYKPYIYGDRTFVPIRLVAEKFESKVEWIQDTKSVVITKGKDMLVISIDKDYALKNGVPVEIQKDSIAKLVEFPGGQYRTMVPLRLVSELLGFKVKWQAATNTSEIIAEDPIDKNLIKITGIEKLNGTKKNEQIKLNSNGKLEYMSYFEAEKNAVSILISNASFDIKGKTSGQVNIDGRLVETIEYDSDPVKKTSRLRVQLNRYVDHKVKTIGEKGLNISFTNLVTGIRPIYYKDQEGILVENVKTCDYNIMKLSNPFRYVIDIQDAHLGGSKNIAKHDISMGFVTQVRSSEFVPDRNYDKNDNIVRLVLDTDEDRTDGKIKIVFDGNDMIILPLEEDLKETGDKNYSENIPTNPNLDNKIDEEKAFEDIKPTEIFIKKPRIQPNSPDEVVIMIDAGHGGKDSGAIGVDGTYEKDLNLEIAKRLARELEYYGYTVLMTREDDISLSPYDRPEIANKANAHVFISIHANSNLSGKTNGIETLYAPRDTVSIKYDAQKPLAEKIHKELIEKTGLFNRGIKSRPDLIVLKNTEMPAVLVELGFMSNKEELETIKSEEFKEACVEALVNGIKDYIYETYGY